MASTKLITTSKALESLCSEPIEKKIQVIEKLVQLLPKGGFTVIEVNSVLERVGAVFNVKASASFLVSVAMVTCTDGAETITRSVPVGRGLNYSILQGAESAVSEMEMGKYSTVHDILEELDTVKTRPYYYSPYLDPLVFASLGAAIPMFLAGGGPNDIWLTAILGGIVGLFNLVPMFIPQFGPLVDFTSTLVVSFLATLAVKNKALNCHFFPLWIGAVILPIPGFSLAIGFLEIAMGHAIHGVGQVFRSTTCGISMAIATYLGIIAAYPNLATDFDGGWVNFFQRVPFSNGVIYGGCVLFSISVGLLSYCRLSQLPLIVASSLVLCTGFTYGDTTAFSTSEFVGVLALYVFCQWICPFLKQPLYSSLFVCILPFCPGSLFVRGMIYAYTANQTQGIAALMGTVFALVGIAFGVIMGRFIFLPILPILRKFMYPARTDSSLA